MTHPKFDPTGVQTHGLQIMTELYVTETPAVKTRPSVTYQSVLVSGSSSSLVPLTCDLPGGSLLIPDRTNNVTFYSAVH